MNEEERTEFERVVTDVVNAYLLEHDVTPAEFPALLANVERVVADKLRRKRAN